MSYFTDAFWTMHFGLFHTYTFYLLELPTVCSEDFVYHYKCLAFIKTHIPIIAFWARLDGWIN